MSVCFRFKNKSPSGERTVDTGICSRNLNLLAHAQMIELEIGSECGGHGVCGRDRVRPLAVPGAETAGLLSPVTDEERSHLSANELAQGWRLACQCFPERDDLTIDVNLS